MGLLCELHLNMFSLCADTVVITGYYSTYVQNTIPMSDDTFQVLRQSVQQFVYKFTYIVSNKYIHKEYLSKAFITYKT